MLYNSDRTVNLMPNYNKFLEKKNSEDVLGRAVPRTNILRKIKIKSWKLNE